MSKDRASKIFFTSTLVVIVVLFILYLRPIEIQDLSYEATAMQQQQQQILHQQQQPQQQPTNKSDVRSTVSFTFSLKSLRASNNALEQLTRYSLTDAWKKQYHNETTYWKKLPSQHQPNDFTFKQNLKSFDGDYLWLNLKVSEKEKPHAKVPGCTFTAKQYYAHDRSPIVSQCHVIDLDTGIYNVVCRNHGTKCIIVDITVDFCYFQAYQETPKIQPWNFPLTKEIFCSDESTISPNPQTQIQKTQMARNLPKWTLDKNKRCKELILDGHSTISIPSANESCACLKRFDDVYIIGESHVAIFGDYLLHHCDGKNITGIEAGLKHGDLEHKKVHFKGWKYFDELHRGVKGNLVDWLQNKSSIAIWIQIGSWDFSFKGSKETVEKEIELYQKALKFMKSMAEVSRTSLDLRIMATPPMPRGWYWNNHAISALNYKMKGIADQLRVEYVDAFQIMKPCSESLSPISPNHYWHRYDTEFSGNVGEAFYLGVFLPHVCGDA